MDKDRHNMQQEDENLVGEEFVTDQHEDTATQSVEEQNADNVTDWEQKYAELNDAFLRLNAEFDNYRKRTQKEKADILKRGSEKVLLDVISVVDDFDRALENIEKTEDLESVKEGVRLIHSKFLNFLKKHNVNEIETIGQVFDVDRHEAVTMIPAQNEKDKDKIIDSIQKGYTLDDKVIRFPKVIVAK